VTGKTPQAVPCQYSHK